VKETTFTVAQQFKEPCGVDSELGRCNLSGEPSNQRGFQILMVKKSLCGEHRKVAHQKNSPNFFGTQRAARRVPKVKSSFFFY